MAEEGRSLTFSIATVHQSTVNHTSRIVDRDLKNKNTLEVKIASDITNTLITTERCLQL